MFSFEKFTKKYIIIKEESLEDFRDDISKKLLDTKTDKEQELIKSDNDDIIKGIKDEIIKYEENKKKLNDNIDNFEKMLADSDFSKENRKRVETQVLNLKKQIENFDKNIKDSEEKIKNLNK